MVVVLALLGASLVDVVGGASPVNAAPSLTGETLSAGIAHSCALLSGGTVKCWGANQYGALGDGSPLPGTNQVKPVVAVVSGATQIAAGGSHTCALVVGGTVKCWGYNSKGELGEGSGVPGVNRSTPVDVTGLSGVTQVATGWYHTCALVQGGTVKCWGYDLDGQLGNGVLLPGTNSPVPVSVAGLSGVTQIVGGSFHTCALIVGGTVKCWGINNYGQLGDGSGLPGTNSSVPVSVAGLSGVTQIVGGNFHTCALIVGGTVKCWGFDQWGQLGDGFVLPGLPLKAVPSPVDVVGLVGVTQIAGGGFFTCALVSGGTVKCWGKDDYGQLGDGQMVPGTDTSSPHDVVSLSGVTQIAAGVAHACASLLAGTVKCWGSNQSGQLGDGLGSPTATSSTPVLVFGLSGVAQLPDTVSLFPGRLLDSRFGGITADGLFAGIGLRLAGGILQLDVAGRGGVPVDAVAVALNITVTGATGSGFVTVYPCLTARPNASNLNYVAGDTVANLVVAKVDSSGKVCIYTDGPTNLIADVESYYPNTTQFLPMAPFRLLDTRIGGSTGDGLFVGGGPVAPGGEVVLDVASRAGVPGGTAAVVLNVTVTGATGGGFLTVYPCTGTVPNASNLNFVAGQTIANLVITKLSPLGKVCLNASAGTNLIADINGYYPPTSTYVSLDPARMLDTRMGGLTVDGMFQNSGPQAGGTEVALTVLSRGGVPALASTVVLNVTATSASGGGFITVYPCGSSRPNASNLNYNAGQTIPNLVITKVGTNGQVCIYTDATTNILADINGYYP